MALYVSVVEIAELTALPERHLAGGRLAGLDPLELVAIIWGTALGLALAHWFAFRVVSTGFRGEHLTHNDTLIGYAQLGGAAFVAALSSLPLLVLDDLDEQEAVIYVPAIIIGAVGYFVARATGRTHFRGVIYGAIVLALGVAVATAKNLLAGH